VKEAINVNKIKSMGRFPTVGEMFEYYSRDDISAVMYYQAKRWRILMNFAGSHMLEPASERDTRDKILDQLRELTSGLKEHERLPDYPTMHMLSDRGEGAEVRYDLMTEDDPTSWKQAFDQMMKVVEALESYRAFYQIKFSGHRSMHLMIPAESFPRTFQGQSINRQFDSIKKQIKAFLPPSGHANPGQRVVYSTHPRTGMVSLPLSRQEVPNFRPWMANIHTVAVDFDWFYMPDDAVQRNEEFLNIVFGKSEPRRTILEVSEFKPQPVKAYTGDAPVKQSEIMNLIESARPWERVSGARAALVQGIQLPDESLRKLFGDDEADARWFGIQIAMRDSKRDSLGIGDVANLLVEDDDYVVGLGYQLIGKLGVKVEELCQYIFDQDDVCPETAKIAEVAAEIDIQALVDFPRSVVAESLGGWLKGMWVLCGSALCLSYQYNADEIFHNAKARLDSFNANQKEREDAIHQLDLVLRLRYRCSRKRINDKPMFDAADELVTYGYDLRGIIEAMLSSHHPHTRNGAIRFLTRLWWDDSIQMLISLLDSSSSPRKMALKSLVGMGEPAVKPLIQAVESSRKQRIVYMAIEALGQLKSTEAVPIIEKCSHDPARKIRLNARRVLNQHFGIVMGDDKPDHTPDASEVEEN
jgi:hypothetical protein